MFRFRSLLIAFALACLSAPASAAYQFEDITCETTSTAGTGTVTLTGALSGGYLAFNTTITSGNTVPYNIITGSGVSRKVETGQGTFTSPSTLTRTAAFSTDGVATALTLAGTSTVCVGWNTDTFTNSVASLSLAGLTVTGAITTNTLELASGTANTLSASGGVLSIEGVALVPSTRNLTGGTGIAAIGNLSADRTITLDLTELSTATFGAGAFTTLIFDAGATDPTWTYGSDAAALTNASTLTIGSVTPLTNLSDASSADMTPGVQIANTGTGASLAAIRYSTTDAAVARLVLAKSGDAAIGGVTIVASGENLGEIIVNGTDGVDWEPAAHIMFQVDATPGSNDMPGRIVFGVTADAAAVITDRMTLKNDGGLIVGTTTVSPGAGNVRLTNIELGADTDTTLSRSSAGVLAVEGVNVVLDSRTITGGVGIAAMGNLSADRTVTFDATEISSLTWGAGAFTDMIFSGAGAIDITLNFATSNQMIVTQTDAGAAGPILTLYANSASPAVSDVIAKIIAQGKDSGAAVQEYGNCQWTATNVTATTEASKFECAIQQAGASLTELGVGVGNVFSGSTGIVANLGNGTSQAFEIKVTDAGGAGANLILFHDSASPAALDDMDYIYFYGRDSAANMQQYGYIAVVPASATSTTEFARMNFAVVLNGSVGIVAQIGDGGYYRFQEALANGINFKGFVPPAAITSNTTCTFEDDANFIPDTCVGNGVDDTSDERLKKNFVPAGDVGSLIDQVKIYDYQWTQDLPDIADVIRKDAHGFGPKAQELYEVNNYWVRPGGDDPTKKPWTWVPDRVVPYLIVEIQNLRKRVAALEAKQ